ncbi:MAG: hypothetical protein SGI77_00755, partial [Pirellulaceae bacterium]|nr:hypothetical protein [Pirellulaceae bacterium]
AVAPQTPQAIVPAVSAVAPQTPQAIVPAVSAVAVPSVQTPQPVTPPPDQSTPLVSRVASAGRRGKAFVKSTLQRSIPGKQVLRGYRRMRSLAKAGAKRLGKTRIGRGVASAGRRVANSSIGQGFASLVGGTTAATAAAAAGGGGGAVAATAATAGATVAMIAAPIVASVAAVVAFSMAVRNATEDLTEFSPEISAAKARGEVNTAMNRLDRSERIGPKLGQLEDAKNRFNDQTQKLLTDILALGLKFTPIFEAGINTLTLIASTAATAANVIEHGLAAKDVGLALLTPGKEDDKAAAERVAAATQQTKDIALGVAAAAAELFGYRNPEKRDEDLQRLLDLAPVPQRRKMRNP